MQTTTLSAEYLKQLYGMPVPHEVLYWAQKLEAMGFDVVFTGSRIIGGWTEASDWDLVVACALDDPRVLDLKHQMYQINDEIVRQWRDRISEGDDPFDPSMPTDVQIGSKSCEGVDYITTLRVREVNIIIEHRGGDFLDRWRIATDMAIEAGALTKAERARIFEECGT